MGASTKKIIAICVCTINAAAILCNVLGVYLISRLKHLASSQVKIILNIGVVDLFLSSFTIIITVLDMFGRNLTADNESIYFWVIRTSCYFFWFSMFYLLTLERFIGAHFPFRHRRLSTPKRFRNIIIACWGIPIMIGPIFCFTEPRKLRIIVDKYVWVVLDSLFIAFFVSTYLSIFYRKQRNDKRFGLSKRGAGNQKFFGVTTAMLATFLVFETFPSIASSMLFMISEDTREFYQLAFELCWSLNLLADPLIYIFLMPTIRRSQIRCCCHWQNNVNSERQASVVSRTRSIGRQASVVSAKRAEPTSIREIYTDAGTAYTSRFNNQRGQQSPSQSGLRDFQIIEIHCPK